MIVTELVWLYYNYYEAVYILFVGEHIFLYKMGWSIERKVIQLCNAYFVENNF